MKCLKNNIITSRLESVFWLCTTIMNNYWNVFYTSFDLFYKQFNIGMGNILNRPKRVEDRSKTIIKREIPQDEEPPEDIKIEVRKRDRKCLCCGSTRYKQVDQILSKHYGGTHQIDNLQILCKNMQWIKEGRIHRLYRDIIF